MNEIQLLVAAGSVLWAMSIGYLAWWLIRLATQPRIPDPEKGRFELERRNQLRQANWIYRTFEPWIDEIEGQLRGRNPGLEDQVQRDLLTGGVREPWEPSEFLALQRVTAILVATAAALFFGVLFGWLAAAAAGLALLYGYPRYALNQIRKQAERRRKRIKRQLASATDLLALMIEVGGGFHECLTKVSSQADGTALGMELERVLEEIESGRTRKEALKGFAQRISDTDTNDLVFAINQGEELGTPLSTILRNQADQVRQKRSQWAEKACQEAQVSLIFPAMVIMVACIILVSAPFLLSALYSSSGV